MKPTTPANKISPKDLDSNLAAFTVLLQRIHPPKNILDIRYGTGRWARQSFKEWPDLKTYQGFEIDKATCEAAWKNSKVKLKHGPFVLSEQWMNWDLLLADFNLTTQKTRGELDYALKTRPKYIIFTDVAVVKLHLNYRRYGLTGPCLTQYWRSYKVPGYMYLDYAKAHHAASTGLFIRK